MPQMTHFEKLFSSGVVTQMGLLRKFQAFISFYEEILTYKNTKKKVHKQIYA